MTTNHQPKPKKSTPNAEGSRQISLRALARELGVNHSSLSAAVHDGRIDRGVRIDAKGRVVVTDADAAKAVWHDVHVPQVIELSRAQSAARERSSLWDATLCCHVTAEGLFAERNALSVLVTALAAEALGNVGVGDRRATAARLNKRIAARLRIVAELHGASEDALVCAEDNLRSAISMLFDAADDTADIDEDES